jgi:hypothetical protein
MNKNISAASILGVNTSRLKREFKDRQISDATFNSLAKGKFEPYFPSADIQERFREIARDLGDPNVFLEVRPTLKLMEREFRSLPLTGAFDSDINDFLEEDSILPELPTSVTSAQPVVAGQVNTAQTGQTNELTPTELALLSPSEQIIRLRDKNKIT